ncbi:MAG: hypothetical protein HY721_12205 [Planctomycetes bacterium]|nr:hypothetical protein [Planctomycetota bacterium]
MPRAGFPPGGRRVMRGRGRRATLAAGLGVAAVVVWAGLSWRDLAVGWHLRRMRQDPQAFREAIIGPEQSLRGEALSRFLETREGKEALFREFAEVVLGRWFDDEILSGVVRIATRSQGSVAWRGRRREPIPLEEVHLALLWIGPEPAAPVPVGEVSLHVRLKASTGGKSPGSGSATRVASEDPVVLWKGLQARCCSLLGEEFSLPAHPSFRFEFLRGDEAVEAAGFRSWSGMSAPGASQVVCLAYRPDPPGAPAE